MRRRSTRNKNVKESVSRSQSPAPSFKKSDSKKRKLRKNVMDDDEDADSDATDISSTASIISSISDKSCKVDIPNLKIEKADNQDFLVPKEVKLSSSFYLSLSFFIFER